MASLPLIQCVAQALHEGHGAAPDRPIRGGFAFPEKFRVVRPLLHKGCFPRDCGGYKPRRFRKWRGPARGARNSHPGIDSPPKHSSPDVGGPLPSIDLLRPAARNISHCLSVDLIRKFRWGSCVGQARDVDENGFRNRQGADMECHGRMIKKSDSRGNRKEHPSYARPCRIWCRPSSAPERMPRQRTTLEKAGNFTVSSPQEWQALKRNERGLCQPMGPHRISRLCNSGSAFRSHGGRESAIRN
jgi:hypothetical protein